MLSFSRTLGVTLQQVFSQYKEMKGEEIAVMLRGWAQLVRECPKNTFAA